MGRVVHRHLCLRPGVEGNTIYYPLLLLFRGGNRGAGRNEQGYTKSQFGHTLFKRASGPDARQPCTKRIIL